MLENKGNILLSFVKGTVIAVIFSLLSVLVFAFLIKIFSLSMSYIKPVTVVIKIVTVALGAFISIKGEKKVIKGAISGLLIIIITFILYSIIGKGFVINLSLLWEILLGIGIGAIVGVLSNLK